MTEVNRTNVDRFVFIVERFLLETAQCIPKADSYSNPKISQQTSKEEKEKIKLLLKYDLYEKEIKKLLQTLTITFELYDVDPYYKTTIPILVRHIISRVKHISSMLLDVFDDDFIVGLLDLMMLTVKLMFDLTEENDLYGEK